MTQPTLNEKIEAIRESDNLEKYLDLLKLMYQELVASDSFSDFSKRDKENMTWKFFEMYDLINNLDKPFVAKSTMN